MTPRTYRVTICRTTVETRDFEVRATSEKQAEILAQEAAGDLTWEHDANAEYDVEEIRDLSEPTHTLWVGCVNGEWGVWDNQPGFEGSKILEECNSQHHAKAVRDELEAAQPTTA